MRRTLLPVHVAIIERSDGASTKPSSDIENIAKEWRCIHPIRTRLRIRLLFFFPDGLSVLAKLQLLASHAILRMASGAIDGRCISFLFIDSHLSLFQKPLMTRNRRRHLKMHECNRATKKER